MLQRYKVFFNDRMLHFALPGDTLPGSGFEKIEPNDRKQMGKLILDFEESTTINFCISTDSPDQLFSLFSSFFVLLEAAGGLVRNQNGKFLFMRRFGKWDLPKGKTEAGESASQAALREVQEECGISRLTLKDALPPTFHTYRIEGIRILKKTNWFFMDFEGDEKLVPQVEEGITEVMWLAPSQFNLVLNNTYRSLAEWINDLKWDELLK